MDIQFFAAHAGLDDTVEILGIDGDDLVHLAHIERDAAVDGERIAFDRRPRPGRSEEHTSELQSLMRISYAVFCLKKQKNNTYIKILYHATLTDTNTNQS